MSNLNVILVSDHGMDYVIPANFIDITRSLDAGTYKIYGDSPVLQIVPTPGNEWMVTQQLVAASQESGHFKVYNANNLPSRWKINHPYRFGPLIVVADQNYAFQDMEKLADKYEREHNVKKTPFTMYGIHGYDNDISTMRAMFMAKGPAFANAVIKSIKNTNVFNIICRILKVEPIKYSDGRTDQEYKVIFK